MSHPVNLNPWRPATPPAPPTPDAADVWDGTIPPGGYVCSTCGMPTESEPCQDHQPTAYGAMEL